MCPKYALRPPPLLLLPTYMPVYHISALCLYMLKEVIDSSDIGVTGGCDMDVEERSHDLWESTQCS